MRPCACSWPAAGWAACSQRFACATRARTSSCSVDLSRVVLVDNSPHAFSYDTDNGVPIVSWFDDKFHHEVTSKLVYERVNKKLTRSGYPDGRNVKEGSKAIKFHLDYMGWLLDQRRWLAGSELTMADFAAAAHLSCLDYISDVDWDRNRQVREWYAKIKSRPAFRSILADQVSGFPPPRHYADLDF